MKNYLDEFLRLRSRLNNLLHEMSADDYIHPEAMKQLDRYGMAGLSALQDAATLCWCIGTGSPLHQKMMRGGLDIEPKNYQVNYETIPF